MKKSLKIGEFSKIVGIPQQTLRYYEQLGLLNPPRQQRDNGYRFYEQNEFYDVATIKFLKLLGLSLDEMVRFREIDRIEDSLETMRSYHEKLKRDIELKTYLANNYIEIIHMIEKKYQMYMDNPRGIYIEDRQPIKAYFSDIEGDRDWLDFELALQRIQSQMPYYKEIGHNNSLGYIYNDKVWETTSRVSPEKLFVSYFGLDKEQLITMESYDIGRAIIKYNMGSEESIFERISEAKNFADCQQYKLRGDIVVVNVIHRFVLYNDDKQLQEIIIPICN